MPAAKPPVPNPNSKQEQAAGAAVVERGEKLNQARRRLFPHALLVGIATGALAIAFRVCLERGEEWRSRLIAWPLFQQPIGLVILFPLWLGDMPALLKGFLERILQPGFAMEKTAGPAGFRPLLGGRSARIVVTMGMPAPVYRWWFGAHAVKLLRRNILQFVGIRPVRTTLLGGVEAGAPDRRRRWLDAMERLGREAR